MDERNYQDQPFTENNPYGCNPVPERMPEYHHIPQPQRPSSDSMTTASFVLGILSLVFIITGMSTVLGALGILFALLSRKDGPMSGKAKLGLGFSIAGIAAGISLIIYTLFFTPFLDVLSENMSEMMESIYSDEFYDDDDFFDDDFYSEDDYLDEHLNKYFTEDFEEALNAQGLSLSFEDLHTC